MTCNNAKYRLSWMMSQECGLCLKYKGTGVRSVGAQSMYFLSSVLMYFSLIAIFETLDLNDNTLDTRILNY